MGAAEKLAEVAALLIKPWSTKKQGEAESQAIWSKANVEAAALDVRVRAQIRAETDYARHQQNMEATFEQAKQQIKPLEQKLLPEIASGQRRRREHEPDWFFKFANYAQETSDKDIQALWAKVLAGEVVRPGTFSLRLLQLISLMRKSDAQDFEKFANHVWEGKAPLMFQFTNAEIDRFLIEHQEMTDEFYSGLHSWGLIDNSGLHGLDLKSGAKAYLRYCGTGYCISTGSHVASVERHLRLRQLTPLGRELYLLCDPTPNSAYLTSLINNLSPYGLSFTWQIAGGAWPESPPDALSKQHFVEESIWF